MAAEYILLNFRDGQGSCGEDEKLHFFFSFLTASAQILLVSSFSPNTHSWGKGEKKTGFPLTSAHNSGHVCMKLRLAPTIPGF
jgi:hypothetical protein